MSDRIPPTFSNMSNLKKDIKPRRTSKARFVFFAFCGLVLLAGIVYGIYQLTVLVVEKVQDSFSNIWLTDTTVENVASIQIDYSSGETISICYDGQMYHALEIPDALLSQSACQSAFANAAQLLAERYATSQAEDEDAFGFLPSQATVNISFHNGQTYSFEIGSMAPTTAYYYVRTVGQDDVYLMKGLLVNLYAGGKASFREVSHPDLDTDRIVAFEFKHADQPTLYLDYIAKPSGFRFSSWYLHKPFLSDVDTMQVETFLSGLADLELISYVDDCTNLSSLVTYGLEDPETLLSLTYEDGNVITIAIGSSDAMGNRYLRFQQDDAVYLGKADSLSFVETLQLPLLVNEFANILQYKTIDSLTIHYGGQTSQFSLTRKDNSVTVMRDDATIVDENAFQEAFLSICSIQRSNIIYSKELPTAASSVLTLEYGFTDGSKGTVEYLDASVNDFYLRKNGSLGVSVRKDDCAEMLSLISKLLQ